MSGKLWTVQPPWEGCDAAAAEWRVSPLVALLLHNRGVGSAANARAFLSPKMVSLLDPEALPGASEAAGLLADAVRAGRKIALYGDYDVDGITGVAILWHALTLAGADVSFYVPHRVEEGYGLNAKALRSLAADGADLVVTVDCGITATQEADLARELGLTLIITDHHEPAERLPVVAAIVHPALPSLPSPSLPSDGSAISDGVAAASGVTAAPSAYANPNLCGAGVALKLAWAFARRMCGSAKVTDEYRAFLMEAMTLAALGTVADVVPLTGENRVLTRCGLARIKESRLPGVRALLDVCDLNDGEIDAGAVGFRIGPRINAAGRMGHARLAIELFTRADENRAREIALYLDEHNRARQAKERQHTRQAIEMIEHAGLDGDTNRGIVLAGENWHPGVIGIVASRIVDRYHKPAVMIALSNGVGQGSARSVPHFPLHKALEVCDAHLVSHGGHAMAAGLKIETDAVPAFTEAFVAHANNTLSGSAIRSRLRIESEVALASLKLDAVSAIRSLGPFGSGNPKPVFATGWVELRGEPRCVGRNGDHLQVTLGERGAEMKGIAFGASGHLEALKDHRRCRVAFEPIINEFNSHRRVELQIVDFKFPGDE